ncbi:MAG: FAD-dependent oxidoreductase, partial [Phormidesmis sp.]
MKYATSVKQQLDQIKHEDAGSPRKKVLILGAGIAGLAAGYELTMQGHSVEILEASSRLGGRIWTHRFNNGQQGEFGAMRIPASHDYTRHYVEQLGL